MDRQKLEKFTDRFMSDVNAVMNPSRLKELTTMAGFSKFEILPVENNFWRFYQVKH